ncbi:multicomponent K+:H+ antiporter subunit E [Pseudoxanthobacter soli DSM 19599]|uniref:Multicomponent K+:H+ antiporter subunit E n=1 Tax=Pseudoxanthobacter soli DSM 19599 TaxID=1123029 RepID=A0A1M7ZNL4_9HYPH|nr:Na+/H+ antiporter subunit E [Pseudoxanthobacter soli]SHO66461.1 multicomponent K+:H+ antiporter subunit E [Pseudoxanthobacter soli DSM 19599]
MTRLLPYPLLAASLVLMWLLLNGFSLGHLILGVAIAAVATRIMAALEPEKPRVRRWGAIVRLFGLVFVDIIRSNIAVGRIVLRGRPERTGFVAIPLTVRDRTALAVLACVLTATPGTAWVEYRSRTGTLLLHVLDLENEQDWIDLIKKRYEPRLMEIFE